MTLARFSRTCPGMFWTNALLVECAEKSVTVEVHAMAMEKKRLGKPSQCLASTGTSCHEHSRSPPAPTDVARPCIRCDIKKIANRKPGSNHEIFWLVRRPLCSVDHLTANFVPKNCMASF